MRKQRLCTSGLIFKDGKILIVKRSDQDDFLPSYYELPGGKVEFGENTENAVVREVQEEVGIDVKPLYPLHIGMYLNDSQTQTFEVYYLCHINNENQEIKLSKEHSEYKWVNIEELPNIYMTDWMKDCIKNSYINARKIII